MFFFASIIHLRKQSLFDDKLFLKKSKNEQRKMITSLGICTKVLLIGWILMHIYVYRKRKRSRKRKKKKN